MKEAQFYRKKTRDTIVCELCPHMCQLKEGETGLCQVRNHQNGKFYSLVYGSACALNIDPVEKKPLYHFLPGSSTLSIATVGCNLSCLNCQNHQISQTAIRSINFNTLAPEEVVNRAVDKRCQSIAYTYTDPTVYYEYMLDIAKLAKARDVKNILVSAAYINPEPLKQLLPYIDAANIDLKCFDNEVYQQLCGVKLAPVLNALKIINQSATWLEICKLIIPGYTDDVKTIRKMLIWLMDNGFQDVPIHFNRFVPANKLQHLKVTPADTLLEIAELARREGLKHVYIGNLRQTNYTNTYCDNCNQLLISRDAYLVNTNVIDYGKCNNCGQKLKGIWV